MTGSESVSRSQETVSVCEPVFVLVVEDETADFDLVVQGLQRSGIHAHCLRVDTEEEYRSHVQTRPDIILSDYVLPAFSALRALQLLEESGLDIPLIVLTGKVSEETVVECMKRGASDYLLKDRMTRLGPSVRRALREQDLRFEKRCAEANAMQSDLELQESDRRLKETHDQLIRNEKMASLGQLVAGIAHEINNPLAFVMNNLFIVESGLDGLGPELESHLSEPSLGKLRKAQSRLGEMKEGLDRVKQMVLDLRTFSRLDEGEFKTVDIVEMIDSVLLFLKHKMNGRILVEKHYAPLRTLCCSTGRLRQVLMNLMANAVDAIAEKNVDKSVHKCAGDGDGEGKLVITISQAPEFFAISVRDTGAGIAEAIRNKIFDPFFTTKPIGLGTGLGLAISCRIVKDHGGSIEVQSEEGVGTEFIVKIPLNLESQNLGSPNLNSQNLESQRAE